MTPSKSDYRVAKEVLKVAILRLHEKWQQELRELLDRPFDDEIGNAYDRSWMITRKARDWYKEFSFMEEWYRKDIIIGHIQRLYEEQELTDEDLAPLSDEIKKFIEEHRGWYRMAPLPK
ncbi:MAG: hypothetical protein ACI3YD_04855 [Alloprevotella sp.]